MSECWATIQHQSTKGSIKGTIEVFEVKEHKTRDAAIVAATAMSGTVRIAHIVGGVVDDHENKDSPPTRKWKDL